MKTILLVDDNELLLRTCSLALRQRGYRVIEAASGGAGLTLARKHLPDLIISDIHMPGGDGSTLLHDIRSDPELRAKQVVLMTGRPDLVTPRKGMEDGADDFLLKPVSFDALQNCVEARFRRAAISWRVEDQVLTQLRSLLPPQLPHEFFTPLAGIIGLMDLLRSDFPSFAPAEVTEIHGEIYQCALRLQRTLRNYLQILDLQGAASAAEPPPLSSPDVEKSIQTGVHEGLRQNGRRDDVSVRVHDGSILVQPEILSRIVEELVDNACKFSRQGTPVKVELGSDGRLIVTDQGRGLTKEEIQRIGAFQQFDRNKYEQQGLGLGLFLVQKLTATCRAKFLITSQPGEGTQVEVAFPCPSRLNAQGKAR